MIDEQTKSFLNATGVELAKKLGEFYGKITFNFHNGVYVNANVEQSIVKDNLKKRSKE